MKKCPYCAEEIQDEAVKCKHCGEFLDETKRPAYRPPPPLPANPLPWYFRNAFLIILHLSIGPLALPFIWLHPTLSPKSKAAITAALLLLTWALWKATEFALRSLKESLEIYRNMSF